jgi:hypothetical protein
MTAYYEFIAQQVAEEIKGIEDPAILTIYLHAILAQRCNISCAKTDSCKDCLFSSYYCRQIHEIATIEEKCFLRGTDDESK